MISNHFISLVGYSSSSRALLHDDDARSIACLQAGSSSHPTRPHTRTMAPQCLLWGHGRRSLRLGLLLLLLTVVAALVMPTQGFVVGLSAAARQRTRPRGAAASASPGGGGAEEEVVLVVEAARAHALLPGALATQGRLFLNSNQAPLNFVAPNEDVGLNIVAASVKGSGEPVVAFVSPQALARTSKGSTLRVQSNAVVSRPAGVGPDQACVLPYYALSLLPQLMKAGIHDKKAKAAASSSGLGSDDRKLCIVTGAGPDALFAIQILRAWECRVVACSRRDADLLRQAGAEAVVDSSKESFTERYPSYAAVVDTLGTDLGGESIAANLERMKGAAYVSTQPSATRRMQAQGLLQGTSIFGSVFAGKPEVAPTNAHWLPEAQGREVVDYVLKLGPSLSMPKAAPGMSDYMDSILWPKDAELDYRFGFPAPPPTDEARDDWGGGKRKMVDEAALLREYTRRRGQQADDGA